MIYSSMTKLLEEALAKVATLPPAAQEKIGEELLLHVETVDRLRGELDKGIRSLDRGEGRELGGGGGGGGGAAPGGTNNKGGLV
jgi:hypothetical protein